ncbi:helix-turn-helix domain-containing protein [Actinokineospora xionganensis]|uniref:Helix-turn-helix domain-containing protein n=1 Tax=Actinokineospora xionganensis TaxID=2684470 RepID=A0ABR7L6F3_9PSEU|nr:helix-turn-helix transcriptional regulator [Actinokineospora xionganensis]MBC6448276.1 helix-turn-helix domain-containing protein [Actinokineospora xionganensis]
MPSQGPLIPRRRLGQSLRELREAAGMHLEDAAERLECSVSKVSRLETGRGIPKQRDVRDLLALYQVDDQKVIDRLVRLAGDGRRQAWWQDLSDIVSTNLDTFIALESEASNLRYYVQSVVPGMFQTADYARGVFRALYPRDSEVALRKRVDLRMGRQALLAEREDKPRISAVLDEATLHRFVGGPEVMDGQLRELLEISERSDVTLRIYPFSAGPDLGIQCTFVVFTFESEYDRNSVHIELGAGDRWLEQEADVLRYARLFDDLSRKCLSVEDSRDKIRSLIGTYTSKDQPAQ